MNIMELNYWTCWQFPDGHTRMSGFIATNDGNRRWVFSDPIDGVKNDRIVSVGNNFYFKLVHQLKKADYMDTMNNLEKWCRERQFPSPTDISNQLAEKMTKEIDK